MQSIHTFFCKAYQESPLDIKNKAQYTLLMTLTLLVYAILIDLLALSQGTHHVLSMFIFYPLMLTVLIQIKFKKLLDGQMLLFGIGIWITLRYFSYSIQFHYYTHTILILIIGAIIHIKRFQMILINIVVNALILTRLYYLWTLKENTPLTENVLYSSIFVFIGIIALTLLINRIVNIMQNEIDDQKILSALVFKDPLTRLYNRQWFNQHLRTQKNAYHIAMIDIDHFKAINDDFGHAKGDHVLVELAKLMQEKLDEDTCSICRWGGEEFALIVNGLSKEAIYTQLEALRKAIHQHDFTLDRPVTVSLGWTKARENENHETVFSRADQAMYLSKAQGRNRITFL